MNLCQEMLDLSFNIGYSQVDAVLIDLAQVIEETAGSLEGLTFFIISLYRLIWDQKLLEKEENWLKNKLKAKDLSS